MVEIENPNSQEVRIPTRCRTHRTCRYCGETKDIKLFRFNRNQCLACQRAYLDARIARLKLIPKPPKVIPTEKACKKCLKVMSVSLFAKKRNVCEPCKKQEFSEWRKETIEKQNNSELFIERNGKKLKARECRCCSEIKEVKFFKQENQTCRSCKIPTRPEAIERQKKREEQEDSAIYKTCIRCKVTKVIGEGITRKKNPYCKDCSNELNRAKYVKSGGGNKLKLRRHTDLAYNITSKLRSRLRQAIFLDGGKKIHSTETLIGCSFEQFRKYLASKFTGNMTMEKVLSAEIVLDHIVPCTFFDLVDEEEQKRCFHHTNIQPLWKKDNDIKFDTYMGMSCGKIPKTVKRIKCLTQMGEELYNIG